MRDFSKFDNLNQNELLALMFDLQKKDEKLIQKLNENKELFKFLTKKLKNDFSTPPLSLKELEDDKSIGVFKDFKSAKKALMS